MDKVGEQLPAVGATVASLILVFIGLLITSWESYGAERQYAVRESFKRRGWIAFAALLSATLSVVLGMVGIGVQHKVCWPDTIGTACLAISGALVNAIAYIYMKDL